MTRMQPQICLCLLWVRSGRSGNWRLCPLYPRLCCKSLFPLGIKNSPGCRRDFHVKMWGTSSPDDKLTGELGNAFEAAEIGGRWSDRLLAGKLSSGDFGLLQQYRPTAEVSG